MGKGLKEREDGECLDAVEYLVEDPEDCIVLVKLLPTAQMDIS